MSQRTAGRGTVSTIAKLKASGLGAITFLSDGEVEAILRTRASFTYERAWEYWCRRAGVAYDAQPMTGPLVERD